MRKVISTVCLVSLVAVMGGVACRQKSSTSSLPLNLNEVIELAEKANNEVRRMEEDLNQIRITQKIRYAQSKWQKEGEGEYISQIPRYTALEELSKLHPKLAKIEKTINNSEIWDVSWRDFGEEF